MIATSYSAIAIPSQVYRDEIFYIYRPFLQYPSQRAYLSVRTSIICASMDNRIRDRNLIRYGTSAVWKIQGLFSSGDRHEFNTLIHTGADPVIPMISPREKSVILLVACLASFLVPYTGSSITVALPAMATQFHVDAVTLGWITSAYIISAALFIVPFGRFADIRGRKKIFIIGVGIFTLASLACAVAPTESLLIVSRFCQGIGPGCGWCHGGRHRCLAGESGSGRGGLCRWPWPADDPSP